MSIDLGVLNAAIARAKQNVDNTVLEVFQKTAIQVDQAIVLATPRDTGRAANNWLPSLNVSIETARLDAKGDPGQIISEAISVIKQAKLGDTIIFTNNLPYIGALNDGHSTQAPAGFIEKAALAAQTSLTSGIL